MNRKLFFITAIFLMFVLGACHPKQANESAAPNPTPEKENPSEETKSPENLDEEGSTEPEHPEQTAEEIIKEVRSHIKTDIELKLPNDVLIEDGHLTATTTSDNDHYEVNYYNTNVPIPVNDPSLDEAHPYMIVIGTRFESEEAAKTRINYQPLVDGAQEIELGHGIKGYMDAGAGSAFLTWHEGRWSFGTRNENKEGGSEEMVELAKEIVGKFENQLLPAPEEIGAGMFDMNSGGAAANSLMWQAQEVVYEVYTSDPLLLVDTVTERMN